LCEFGQVASFQEVGGLEEDGAKHGLTHRVVLAVEDVESAETSVERLHVKEVHVDTFGRHVQIVHQLAQGGPLVIDNRVLFRLLNCITTIFSLIKSKSVSQVIAAEW
jgi:hypothetical protein